jgi:hypothetical protein
MELGYDIGFSICSTFASVIRPRMGIDEGDGRSTAGGSLAVVLILLPAHFSLLKISFPCRRRHIEVVTLMKAVIDR